MERVNEQALSALPLQLHPYIIGKGWVCTLTAGKLVTSKGNPLPPEMRVFAIELCVRLNTELHLDGAWAVGWTDFAASDGFPKRLLMAYIDKDGDLIFVVDAEDPFLIMVAYVDDYIEQCAQAYTHTQGHLADVGVNQNQRIKAALGQESKDPSAEADWVTDRL